MISFSYWYLKSREGICLVFVLGVTAIATWLHRGDIHSADKSGAIKEPVVINLILRQEGGPPCPQAVLLVCFVGLPFTEAFAGAVFSSL